MEFGMMGSRINKIDAKNRISVPATMRAGLGERFIVSYGDGKYLALYPKDEWDAFIRSIHEKVPHRERKKLLRHFFANAEEMSLDAQGRLLLSDILRERAGLQDQAQATVLGNGKRIEIWNTDLYNAENEDFGCEEAGDTLDKYDVY